MDAIMVLVTRRENKCTQTIAEVFDEKSILSNSRKTMGYKNFVKKFWTTFCSARFKFLLCEKSDGNGKMINYTKIIFFPKSHCVNCSRKKN